MTEAPARSAVALIVVSLLRKELSVLMAIVKKVKAGSKPCAMDKPTQEYFLLMEDGERALIKMVCTPPWTNDTGGCRARFLHHGLSITLIFRRAELERWQEFVDGSKRILDRFVINDK